MHAHTPDSLRAAPRLARRRLLLQAALAGAAALSGPGALGGGAPASGGLARYTTGPRSADGIGKFYRGREISGVMGWQGAAWLERAERDKEERTDLLLAALQLRPGLQVADVGAGSGYLARRMAPLVAPGGVVWATDVQPEMLRLLEDGARRAGITNLRTVQGTEQDARLPAGTIDVAVLVDVYHELAFPWEVTDSIVRALTPGGRLVLVEYRADDPRVPIKPLHTMSEAQILREMADHPRLRHERTVATLPMQHIVVLRRQG